MPTFQSKMKHALPETRACAEQPDVVFAKSTGRLLTAAQTASANVLPGSCLKAAACIAPCYNTYVHFVLTSKAVKECRTFFLSKDKKPSEPLPLPQQRPGAVSLVFR